MPKEMDKRPDDSDDHASLRTLERMLTRMITQPHGIYQPVSDDTVLIEYHCNKCNGINTLQLDFADARPLREGCIPFPPDNQLYCVHCGTHHDVTELHKDATIQFHTVTENA